MLKTESELNPIKRLSRNAGSRAVLTWYKTLDLKDGVSELINIATFSYTIWRGTKGSSDFLSCQSEERWGNQTLVNLEKWLTEKGANAGEPIGIPAAVWLLNPYYLRPGYHRMLPVAVAGQQKGDNLHISTYYPSLLSYDPKIASTLKAEFESKAQPTDSTKCSISVSQIFVGETAPELSFTEEVRKKLQQENSELIGIYKQNLRRELATVCKPGYANKILRHPGLTRILFYKAESGQEYCTVDDVITNLIINSRLGSTVETKHRKAVAK